MTAYYIVMSLLALMNLFGFLMFFREKKLNYYILAMLALMTVSNAGNLLMAVADTLAEAYVAKKVYYVGGCFIPPIILIVIFKMCNIQLKKWVENVFYFYSFAVYGLVLTIGYSTIYYKSAGLTRDGSYNVFTPEYGICHSFFYVLLYGYLLIGIIVLLYSLKEKNQVSRKNLWLLIGIEVLTITLFLGGRLIKVPVELTPVMYVIDGWILLYLCKRVAMYSLEDNIVSSLGKQERYGYIMFDKRRNYLGANRLAVKILPELMDCKIDRSITGFESLAFLQKELDEYDTSGDALFTLSKEKEHFEGHISEIWYADKAVGYLFELENDTDKYMYTQLLATYNDKLKEEVEEKTESIRNMQAQILLGMADMLENRDGNTGGHIKRTSHVVEILIGTIKAYDLLQLDERFCRAVIKAAPMHDLGKIGVDDQILRKPWRLTREEFAIMKTHAAKSGELVESILRGVEEDYFVDVAKNIGRHHHEKWNGEGYPDGLKGEEIPLEARIMAIADVYDALVSKRCYKEAMSFEQASRVMLESMGSHFDPQMEEVFLKSRDKLEAYYSA